MIKFNAPIGALVHIEWEDHYSHTSVSWVRNKDLDVGPVYCETIGWVAKIDKDRVLLAMTAQTDGNEIEHSSHHHVILRRAITRWKRITQFKARK